MGLLSLRILCTAGECGCGDFEGLGGLFDCSAIFPLKFLKPRSDQMLDLKNFDSKSIFTLQNSRVVFTRTIWFIKSKKLPTNLVVHLS